MTRDHQRESAAGTGAVQSGQRQQPGRQGDRSTGSGHGRHRPGGGHEQRTQHGPPEGKPAGLQLVAVTLGVLGGLSVFAGLVLSTGGGELPGGVGAAVQLVGLLTGALGVGHLLAGYGLWTVAPWGRRLALWLAVGNALLGVLVLLGGGSAGLFGVVLYGAMSWYLHGLGAAYRRLQHGPTG